MSRSAAFKSIPEKRWRDYLAERGITLIGGSVDEAPMAYKEIETVVGLQGDLVDLVGRFTPKVVRHGRRRQTPEQEEAKIDHIACLRSSRYTGSV